MQTPLKAVYIESLIGFSFLGFGADFARLVFVLVEMSLIVTGSGRTFLL